MSAAIRPMRLRDANRFIAEHHSHNGPTRGWLFGVGLEQEGELVGVGVAGRPVSRGLDNGYSVEITRVCTTGTPNACSQMYGRLCRAATALGYRDAWTYTLQRECAACVKAAGFIAQEELAARPGSWNMPSRPRLERDLFGVERVPSEAKVRWHRKLAS